MTPERTRFDDPQLRSLVRRAWGDEVAPPELRRRVGQLIAAEKENAGQAGESTPEIGVIRRPAQAFWRRRVVLGSAAAAAVVMLSVGVALLNRTGSGVGQVATTSPQPASLPDPVALPPALGHQLVRGHDLCVRVHADEHHLLKDAPKDNYAAIARELEGKMQYPVLATPVGGNWTFHGASVCPVGKMRVAHLMYTQGDAFLSVYSLPASSAPTLSDKQSCEADVNGRPVTGFVDGKTFFVVLASSGGNTVVDREEVRAIRDRLRDSVVAMRRAEDAVFLAFAR